MQRVITIGFIALLLSACGGGGGGGGTTPEAQVASVPDQQLGGIWIGTGTNSLQPGLVISVVALSTDQGEMRFITGEGVQSVGSISASGDQLTGSSVDYAPLGSVFSNGLPTTTGSFAGTIVERQSIDGTWQSSTNESGNFVFLYDDRHAIPSSLATVSGTYTGYDEFNVPIATISIDGTGSITGSDAAGCIYGGNIQIIDSMFNVYRLNVTVANCGLFDGTYTGLGGYDPADSSLAYQVDNTAIIISNEIYK